MRITEPADARRMPCRKEDFLVLERAVNGGSKDVDALISRIGEALQLHGGSPNTVSCLRGLSAGAGGLKPAPGTAASKQQSPGCCLRLRGQRGGTRASPYHIPASHCDDWDHVRPWRKQRFDRDQDEARRLQELLLSGNLIKEAVRRLQDCGDFGAADGVSCS